MISRRGLLQLTACGFGSIALAGLCAESASASPGAGAVDPLAARLPMIRPRAKRIIFLFMQGGPSQVDTFDYKPALGKYDGQKLDFADARTLAKTGMSGAERVMKSLWGFQRHGQCGQWVSDLFPHVARHVDDVCFLHGMHTNGVAHGPSTLFLHTGSVNLIRPSVGSWITYGLGTENDNLPGFITIGPSSANGGPRNYSNAFLPAHFQGTALGRAGVSAAQMRFRHIENPQFDRNALQRQYDLWQATNRAQAASSPGTTELDAVIHSYELAWRMQMHAPHVTDISNESRETRAKYGIGEKETDDFGRQCLLARRMAEAGVRYIQVNYADNDNNPRWDQHAKIGQHAIHARAVDKPIAGLIADMKARGLLEDTLIWWGGEFGRNPFAQGSDGRDHNPKGFTHFLVGGGVKPGFAFGATDEFGHEAVEGRVHMHDLHATLLYILGLDHEKLTYNYAGREFRLTDVHGRVVREILS
jgi:hypothetical protein